MFDEARHFSPGTKPLQLFEVAGVRVGLAICEDLWIPDGPIEDFVAGGAELLVTVNGSPYDDVKFFGSPSGGGCYCFVVGSAGCLSQFGGGARRTGFRRGFHGG